ncbi:AtuA-related protein, partial [Mycolicibacterium pyrenivorans]|uniref:AtuA-related protein n=1 Tax=Mycolicibacterium pyrenivorans TaxID=187102 RepID=UPI003FD78FD8
TASCANFNAHWLIGSAPAHYATTPSPPNKVLLGLAVLRYELPNLKALNFVIVGYLGEGVASCTRTDPQAKGLGEYLRALYTEIPDKLVP